MAFIETVKVGKYHYFRLVETYREDGKVKRRVLKHLGKSDTSFRAAVEVKKKLSEAIERYPDLASKNNVQAILTEYKRRTVKIPEMPPKLYRTIVIDPPWPVEKIRREERPWQVEFGYPIMTIEEIKQFPLPADPTGCHVYLWCTHRFLPVAFEVFQEWGVVYECHLTWVKNVGFTPFSWMYSTEDCLFGRCGSLPLLKLGKRLDFNGKVREHSRKPDEFYDLIREVSPEPRIDIFSREKREGFDQFGNEEAKFSG